MRMHLAILFSFTSLTITLQCHWFMALCIYISRACMAWGSRLIIIGISDGVHAPALMIYFSSFIATITNMLTDLDDLLGWYAAGYIIGLALQLALCGCLTRYRRCSLIRPPLYGTNTVSMYQLPPPPKVSPSHQEAVKATN
jgi:hypothetical protein